MVPLLLGLVACTGDLMDASPMEQPDAAPGPQPDASQPTADAPAHFRDGGVLADRVCPPDSFLSYANFGAGFMSQYCTGCHSVDVPMAQRHDAPLGVDFETLDKVREHMEFIYVDAADFYDKMPPAGGPKVEDRMRLGEWLACGAPE